MTKQRINEAKRIAKDFLDCIKEMEQEEEKRVSSDGKYHYDSPAHRGTVRRRSMDLTRALANLRRSE